MLEYKILQGRALQIQELINQHLNAGWNLHGGLVSVGSDVEPAKYSLDRIYHPQYAQAVTRVLNCVEKCTSCGKDKECDISYQGAKLCSVDCLYDLIGD